MILDEGIGYGGIMAVPPDGGRLHPQGIADVGIDDQPIEGKRGTGTAGVGIQSLDVVLTRYRAAVDRKRELVPNFVVMAQCYVAEAVKGGFEESLVRMKAYEEIAEVDWVQLTVPCSVEQMRRARDAAEGPFSIIQAYMDPLPSNEELFNLGINLPCGCPGLPTMCSSTTSSKIPWSEAPAPGMTSRNSIRRTHT